MVLQDCDQFSTTCLWQYVICHSLPHMLKNHGVCYLHGAVHSQGAVWTSGHFVQYIILLFLVLPFVLLYTKCYFPCILHVP